MKKWLKKITKHLLRKIQKRREKLHRKVALIVPSQRRGLPNVNLT